MTVRDSDIDAAILSVATASWRKVAFIVGRAREQLGGEFAQDEAGYQIVATRIQALAADGRLASQGDLTQWRFSEVKLPSSNT